MARSGRYLGSVVNPDTGSRVEMGDRWLITADFRKARLGEVIGGAGEKEEGADLKPRRPIYSPLWQADGKRIRRVAPAGFHWALYAQLVRLRHMRRGAPVGQ